MEQEVSNAFATVVLTACATSLAALFFLFQKHVSGEPLLPYEPRRSVPWGPLVVVLAMGMPLLGVVAFFAFDHEPPTEKVPAEQMLSTGWANFTFMVVFVFGLAGWIAVFFRANAHDLGLPTSARQLARDIGIGALATVAALLPIYVIQLTLINVLQSETKHPLVEQLQENHSPAMLTLGIAMAVIAAPLFEEFTFRGLLQGWLERREDEVLGYTATQRQPAATDPDAINTLDDRDASSLDAMNTTASHPTASRAEQSDSGALQSEPDAALKSPPPRPPHGWLPELPHGWTPILISGVAFGLAHIGHGVAPISLVLFGIVLGYLYQRTHRLVPSLTAHMLFNGYSMLLLWLQLQGQ